MKYSVLSAVRLASIVGLITFSGCPDSDGPLEEAGEKIDDAAKELKDGVDDAADDIEDATDG